MSFVIEKPKSAANFTLMPEGFNEAVVSEVKDMGEQPNPFYEQNVAKAIKEGKDPARVSKTTRKCLIVYKDAEGNEAGEIQTASLSDKANLTKRIKSITGEEPTSTFDLDTLVGMPVTVQVEHFVNKKGYDAAKVIAVARRKSAAKAPAKSAASKKSSKATEQFDGGDF